MDTLGTQPFVLCREVVEDRFSFVEKFVIFQSVGSTECTSVQWNLTLLGQVVITY